MQSQNNIIYLDHAATTPLDGGVLSLMTPYLTNVFGNASSQHSLGREAANALTAARDKIAVALGIFPSELYFTSGGTEADNLGIKGLALAGCERGRHVVVSAIEHPAVIESAFALQPFGFEIDFVYPDERGVVTPEAVGAVMRQNTVLVAVMSANNETGVIQPVADIYNVVKERGALLWCDCVQTAGVLPLSLFPADGHAISAHKFYGPKGVGAAHIRKGVRFVPQMNGGHQERGLRGGTSNTAAAVGMAEAFALSLSRAEEENKKIASLRDAFEELVLAKISGVHINGGGERLPSHSNLSFEGCDGQNIVMLLDMNGVAASTGSACTSGAATPSHVLQAMGFDEKRVRSAVRFSFGRDNTLDEVKYSVEILQKIISKIRNK